MKISLLMGEVSNDPETAIELATEWGVRDFELRGFFTDRAPRFSAYQKQRLREALDDYQARVVALAPGLFKIPYPLTPAPRATLGWLDWPGYRDWDEARRAVRYELDELLPASLDYTNELGAGLIVIFCFDRAGAPAADPPDEILDCLRRAAERAGAAGVGLALENERGLWADTGERLGRVVHAINNRALGVNWDPANAVFDGSRAYLAGYTGVRGLVTHLHFKDVRRDPNGEMQCAVEGEVGWEDQINALAADGYDRFISIETHLRPKVAGARTALERLRRLIAAAGTNLQTSETQAA